jgi:hypothetical protein
MSKVEEIAGGFKNLLRSKLNLTTEEEEILFKTRRKVCDACPSNKDNLTCSTCGCVLAAKVRAINTECPEKHW